MEVDDPAEQVMGVFQALAEHVGRNRLTPELEDRVLVGLFSFEKLPVVNDLRNSVELLASHDVIAAAAGFTPAVEALNVGADERLARPDDIHPQDEFLVMDADSSQQQAITAVLAGHHVVIQGPPGTGKSQTIANIIASAAAQGKRILFVAEKRAAIEAVTERLERVDLHHLVFDLDEQKVSKRQVAEQVAVSPERASKEMLARTNGLHAQVQHAALAALGNDRAHACANTDFPDCGWEIASASEKRPNGIPPTAANSIADR